MTEKFQQLVQQVKQEKLKPAEDLSDEEREMDEAIRKHEIAWVISENKYLFRCEDGCWIRLSWAHMRRNLPRSFRTGPRYKEHERILVARLKAHGRVFRACRFREVTFE